MNEQITENIQIHLYDSGIEDDNESEVFDDPFNPEEISIDSKGIPMETCLRRLTQGSIFLNPDFQRNEVWTLEKKSQLIESLILKIPLPMFYVSADEKNNYTVVDGLQRLSTIRSFILGDEYLKSRDEAKKGQGFRLQNLEFWKAYEGDNFQGLPSYIQNRILETEFQFTIINPGTPEEVKRNIFKRLNTGGLPLSSQEIRNALYIGQSTTMLNELSRYTSFLLATDYAIKSQRMEDKGLILRFLSFLVRDYSSYKRTITVDTFLSNTMIIINSMPIFNSREFHKLLQKKAINTEDILFTDITEICSSFNIAMLRAHKLFDKHTFRKSYGDNRRSPINKSLFEMWGVLLCKLSDNEFLTLLSNKVAFIKAYIPILKNVDFQIAISRDSMKHTAVTYRFETINTLINTYIS